MSGGGLLPRRPPLVHDLPQPGIGQDAPGGFIPGNGLREEAGQARQHAPRFDAGCEEIAGDPWSHVARGRQKTEHAIACGREPLPGTAKFSICGKS